MLEFDSLPADVRDTLFKRLSLKDILRLSSINRSASHHCVSFLHDHPCKWLMKALAAKSVPAVVQVLGRLPCKPHVLQLMMPQLLRIPDIPQTLVEILVESGAVPSQTDLLAAVEAGVPGLEMWPRTCKASGVPTRLPSILEAIWCNTTVPVRPVPGTSFFITSLAYISAALAGSQEDTQGCIPHHPLSLLLQQMPQR
jgi:hypothetical protein